jgi:ethanolamine utilization protein EutN
MQLAKVVGQLVASHKYPTLKGVTLLMVTPLNHNLEVAGETHCAVDSVNARYGDLVYLVGSREASLALENTFAPVDSAIVGIVDSVG